MELTPDLPGAHPSSCCREESQEPDLNATNHSGSSVRRRLVESIARGESPFPSDLPASDAMSLARKVRAHRLTDLLGWMAIQIVTAMGTDSADEPKETDRC